MSAVLKKADKLNHSLTQMSVTGNIGNRRHTTSDSGNDGNKVPNPKLQLLVTLVTV